MCHLFVDICERVRLFGDPTTTVAFLLFTRLWPSLEQNSAVFEVNADIRAFIGVYTWFLSAADACGGRTLSLIGVVVSKKVEIVVALTFNDFFLNVGRGFGGFEEDI